MVEYAFAELSVNSPIAQRRTFSYKIPDGLNIDIGQAVWVPFGNKILQGVVLELTPYPSVEETREIAGVIDSVPLLSPDHIALSRWLSDYYLSPLFDSIGLMLPPGFERRVITSICPSSGKLEISAPTDPIQKKILEYLLSKKKANQKEIEKAFGVRRSRIAISQLIHEGLAVKNYALEKARVKPKIMPYLRLKVGLEEARVALEKSGRQAKKQSELLRFLIQNNRPIPLSEAKHQLGCAKPSIQALIEKGLIEVQEIRIERDPLSATPVNLSFPLPLTSSQTRVFQAISEGLRKVRTLPAAPDAFLLHGVTGSGKTEIYIQALEEAVKLGKRGIVLVPEISMTPQVIDRFVSRFPSKVAILHSELSLGERFDEWWRIKNGEFDVVIGPRSAIFAPQPNLGLIILDEEHEWTYKQEDSPRYHTREVALKLAEKTGAVVVLGSATPDIESYFRALHGQYHLLELPERVTPGEGSPLPQVEVVDLKTELKAGNLSLFSRSLHNSIKLALQNGEQVMLFLNRRGSASFIECRNCGWVIRCKRCEVPLSYHFNEEKLICHQCNLSTPVPQICPRCQSRRIKYLGVGTEKLEQETAKVFPQARLLRWDSDAVQGRSQTHQKIFNQFKSGQADILIGTQMIAKGLDLPGVTLVGVISADIALNLPDFRSGERTFQLLSQVAGRAGRGLAGGRVIIQTYSPEHYSVQAAAKHDYLAFYQQELNYRRELRYPPFGRLVRLIFTHTNDSRCQAETERLKLILQEEKDTRGLADVSFIGPAPAFVHRLRGKFRWQLVLRASDPAAFLSNISFPRGWIIDIDPVGLT